MRRFLLLASLLSLLLAGGGCNTAPNEDGPAGELSPMETQQQPALAYAPILRAQPRTGSAVESILLDARSALNQGNYQVAAAMLERAVRIEPKNAMVWHTLARVRFNQGRYQLAANLASKSFLLARGDAQLMADNQRLIQQARQAVQ